LSLNINPHQEPPDNFVSQQKCKTMLNLKNVLLLNALSSGATGLLLVLFPGYVANLFGTGITVPFTAVGIFLLLFALLVFLQSSKTPLCKGWVKAIIALDVLWVVESFFIVFPKMFGFTTLGYILIGAVAFWVALMAFLQMRGLKQFSTIC
jgi:hypothetical protein